MRPSTPSLTTPDSTTQRLVVWGFFIVLFLLGIWLVGDYGVSVDEMQSRMNGMVTLKYLSDEFFPEFLKNRPEFGALAEFPLHRYYDRDYGVAFELPVVALEQVLGLTDKRDVFLLRHFCTFLVCFGGVVAVYQLARRRFASWQLGLLAAAMMVLSPRLFAEFFYNDKDAVFMAMCAIAANTGVALLMRPTWGRVGWHALACALTIDVRIMGVLVPLATMAVGVLQAFRGAYRGQLPLLKGVAFSALMAGLVIAFWPYLWEAPIELFSQAFSNMSKFRWNSTVLYKGSFVQAAELPWHYAPVWIGITTPILYLVGFVVGTGAILWQLVRRHWRLYATDEEWQDLLFLGLAVAPLAAVIALHSVLYDGWRQVYFVYPFLLLVSMRGLVVLLNWRPNWGAWQQRWPWLTKAAIGACLLVTAGQMVTLHPLQNMYFNALLGRHEQEHFEMDYWMMSYRQGLEWIAKHDDRTHIKVSAQMHPSLETNRLTLPEYDRNRMEVLQDFTQADYYLTTYRWHPQPYTEFPYEVYTISHDGHRVLSVFRVKW